MKTIKIRRALLLTLTLFTALQAVTTFGMESGNEKIENKKDFLWKILDETTLEKKLTDEELIPYINKIKELYEKNCDIFKNKRDEISPRIFAAFNCRYQIGKIIDNLRDASKNRSTEKDKNGPCAWSEEMSKKLHDAIKWGLSKSMEAKEIVKEEKKEDSFGTWTLMIDLKTEYNGMLQIFECNLFEKNQTDIAKLKVSYYPVLATFYVNTLDVNESHRRQGIGAHLLRTTIDVLRENYKTGEIASALYALPDKKQMFSKLLNYYKSFGYEPIEKTSNARNCELKLTIKNGAIVHRWETPISTKLDN